MLWEWALIPVASSSNPASGASHLDIDVFIVLLL